VEEIANISIRQDIARLCERARRAREEAERLAADQQFIFSWCQMRPRSKVRPSPMLDE
jgi:hypothetical protein